MALHVPFRVSVPIRLMLVLRRRLIQGLCLVVEIPAKMT
jgi:hypothetical protein